MADRDDPKKKTLRDTTKPENRPSWGRGRDNAPKGAPSIDWTVKPRPPVLSPSGPAQQMKSGLFAKKAARHPAPPEMPKSKPVEQKITGVFSREANEQRAERVLMEREKRQSREEQMKAVPKARIIRDDRSFGRFPGRDDDEGPGR